MRVRFVFALALGLVATRAWASDEGGACAVTADCDEALRCVDGICMSLSSVRAPRTTGDVGMFGDRTGYAAAIIGSDSFALAGMTAFFAVASSIGEAARTGWQVSGMVPVVTGPIVHLTHGRWLPAIVSLFGWSSLGATAFVVSLLQGPCIDCNAPTIGGEVALLAVGGSLLTALDAWMARDVRKAARRQQSWFPFVTPSRAGALAGVGGAF